MMEKSILFRDLSPSQTREALQFFAAQEKEYARGEVLKSAPAPLTAFGLVLTGHIDVTMEDIDGREMLLAHVTAGQTFGEALCYLHENAPITITARTDCRVLWLRCDALHAPAASPLARTLQARFTAMLARRTLQMNDRIQTLSRTSMREKLTAFFTECARDAGGPRFTIPFDRAGMAAYLGVDRSALSRELSAMQKAGLIAFRKNQFTLTAEKR